MEHEQWISKNRVWKIHKPNYNKGLWLIENLKTGFCDYPIFYKDTGRAYFDYPETIPQYVRDRFIHMELHN